MKFKIFFALAAAAAALFLLAGRFLQDYALLDGRFLRRSASVLVLPEGIHDVSALNSFPHLRFLDLRGNAITPEEYQAIAGALPDCRILWELKFQDGRLPASARELTVQQLTDEDVEMLSSLNRLRFVEAAGCRDYPQLHQLALRHPGCRIHYTVPLGGRELDCAERVLAPESCTADELAAALRLLPEVQSVDLRRCSLDSRAARVLCDNFPNIRFLWEEKMGDVQFLTDAEQIDLSGVAMEDTAAVEELLPYLPNVKKIIMCDCGISSEDMDALGNRHPEVRFVWRVKLGPLSARTDDTWFAPITHHQLIGGHDADELKYCIDMECIDLGHCWIRDCQWAANMKELKYLVLADSYVTDLTPLSNLKKLKYLELFVTPVRDYSPLLGCTGLEDLNLGYTYGDPEPISRMHWLKNLWWGGIHHVAWFSGREPAALLRERLTDTRLMFYAGSSTGLGWRQLPHYYEMRDRIGMYYMNG